MSPSVARRRLATTWSFIWLALVPTAFAVAGWVEWFGPYELDSRMNVVLSLVPLLGLLVVLEHALISRSWLVLVPFVPFAIAAIAFALAWRDLRAMCIPEPDCAAIPVVAYGAGLLLPFLAFFGGLISWITYREPSTTVGRHDG